MAWIHATFGVVMKKTLMLPCVSLKPFQTEYTSNGLLYVRLLASKLDKVGE